MKLIDEKGRILGRVNIVDLIALVAVLAVVGAIAVSLLGSRVQDAVSPKVDCYAEVAIVGAPPRIYSEVLRQDLVGERLVSGNEFLSATVEDVWLEDYVEQVPTADGSVVDALIPSKKSIIVLVKTQVPEGTPSPKIGSQELRAGKTYIVKTQLFESSGTIRFVQLGGDYVKEERPI